MEIFQMSKKEINQTGVFERLAKKEIKQKEVAKMLDLSTRQIRKKLKEFRRLGPVSLIHKLRGKPSNNHLDDNLINKALEIIEEKYPDFGPTFASEKLWENHMIKINSESLRLKMIKVGLWQAKAKKISHRSWRERKECLGELVQLDGSPHDWFEGRAPICTLLAFIDDSTSKVLHLEFAEEATIPVMRASKNYFEKYGLPRELYVDRGKVFKVNIHNEDEDKITQYRRAIEELGIKMTYARSPEAKGRVERLFGTLQDRLVKELRLKGISNIKDANKFILDEYLAKHNAKYAIFPKSTSNLHRKINNFNLDDILCLKEKRMLNSDFTLRFKNKWFQLEKKQNTLIFPKNEITITTHLGGNIGISIRNTKLNYHEINKPLAERSQIFVKQINRIPWIPPVNHPWRNYEIKKQKEELSTLLKAELST